MSVQTDSFILLYAPVFVYMLHRNNYTYISPVLSLLQFAHVNLITFATRLALRLFPTDLL